MRPWRLSTGMRCVPIVIALTLAPVLASAACAPSRTHGVSGPVMAPVPRADQAPQVLTGGELTAPTGLRLLTDHGLIDVDSATLHPVSVDTWLVTARREPILLRINRHEDMSQPLRATTAPEPGLPGKPTVTTIDMYGGTSLAAATDGRIWVREHRGKTTCTLRRLGEPERLTACENRLVIETPHGLWVRRGVNQEHAVLLDPATLAEKRTFPQVAVIDEHRVLSWGPDRDDPVLVHDMRTNRFQRTQWPDFHGWPNPGTVTASPDGTTLAFRFGNPSASPQIQDVWTLDLTTLSWVRPPAMPVLTALKSGTIAWAPDGTLLMLAVFYEGRTARKLVAAWRPGQQRWALRTVPETGQFIVL